MVQEGGDLSKTSKEVLGTRERLSENSIKNSTLKILVYVRNYIYIYIYIGHKLAIVL